MTPSDHEPTDAQRASLRAALERLQGELTRLIADEGGLADTVDLDQSRMGRVSRVDALQHQQMAKATRRRHAQRLERVEAAIERFDDDPEAYGCCPDCGEWIDFRRLEAFPESIFCVPCLQARGR